MILTEMTQNQHRITNHGMLTVSYSWDLIPAPNTNSSKIQRYYVIPFGRLPRSKPGRLAYSK